VCCGFVRVGVVWVCVGVWVCGCMGVWVRGWWCVGVWGCGCVGAWLYVCAMLRHCGTWRTQVSQTPFAPRACRNLPVRRDQGGHVHAGPQSPVPAVFSRSYFFPPDAFLKANKVPNCRDVKGFQFCCPTGELREAQSSSSVSSPSPSSQPRPSQCTSPTLPPSPPPSPRPRRLLPLPFPSPREFPCRPDAAILLEAGECVGGTMGAQQLVGR